MVKTKLIYDPVTNPGQLEIIINNTLELLQESFKCKILDVKLSNGQALIVYDEPQEKKTKKVLNERV